MEWGHRLFGRVIGLAYTALFLYFAQKGWITGPLLKHCVGLLALGGLQGALGWYMVKSGLDHSTFEENNSVPRVSHFRLTSHLLAAIALYTGLFWTGMVLLIMQNLSNFGIEISSTYTLLS